MGMNGETKAQPLSSPSIHCSLLRERAADNFHTSSSEGRTA